MDNKSNSGFTDTIYDCQIIGGGAAALSFFVSLDAALHSLVEPGKTASHLARNTVMIERDKQLGGSLAHYAINANTHWLDLTSGISPRGAFADIAKRFNSACPPGNTLIPLQRVANDLLQPIAGVITRQLAERLKLNTAVTRIEGEHGIFTSFDKNNLAIARSRTVLICTGAREHLLPELQNWQQKTVFSEALIRLSALERVVKLLKSKHPVAIIGASHSAFSVLGLLLQHPQLSAYLPHTPITVYHRRDAIKLRLTTDNAKAVDYPYDPVRDLCTTTNLLHRNGGLRKDAKHLYLRIRDGIETRARLQLIKSIESIKAPLDDAAVIFQCTGFSADDPPVRIDGHQVDTTQPITPQGVYRLGLGSQTFPSPAFRGEPGHTAAIDGFQFYQLDAAPGLLNAMLGCLSEQTHYDTV